PKTAKNIAWLDCDVIFERPDWMDEAEQKLSEVNAVQLYSELIDLGPEDYQPNIKHIPPSGHGIVSAIKTTGLQHLQAAVESGKDIRQPFPTGMAWAARRKILEGHGLYDAQIIGGGDRAMVHAMYGQFEVPLLHFNKLRQEHFLRWARGYHRDVAGKIGNGSGRIFHLWHGNFV